MDDLTSSQLEALRNLARKKAGDEVGFVNIADACRVAESLNLFTLAPSLGGVDSLVTIPVLTSHYMIDPELREKMGVTEQMIRLSVGLEHVEDLIADLEKGLSQLSVVSHQPSVFSHR